MRVATVDASTGQQETRPARPEEVKQQQVDDAESAKRAAAADEARRRHEAKRQRAAALAGKAKAGTLTAAERDEALALLLDR